MGLPVAVKGVALAFRRRFGKSGVGWLILGGLRIHRAGLCLAAAQVFAQLGGKAVFASERGWLVGHGGL